MKISHFFLVFMILWAENRIGFGQNGNNYITWDDLIVHGRRGGVDEAGDEQDRVIIVDKNGRGDSLTVQGAVDMVPVHNSQRVKIHILPGIYREKVFVPASKPYISFIGDEASETIISWNNKASDKDPYGSPIGTTKSASVAIESDFFCASGITFENTANEVAGAEGNQAVALRISGDKAVFFRVRFLGSQDTLLDDDGSHLFFRCFIQGSVDFIFGDARSLYRECIMSVVGDGYAIAAQKRELASEDTGFSFVNCTVKGNARVYLGRAWGSYSRIIYSYTVFDIDVVPAGWDDWGIPSRQNSSVVFGEYGCSGRGADRGGRVGWSRALNDMEAKQFLDSKFVGGQNWLKL